MSKAGVEVFTWGTDMYDSGSTLGQAAWFGNMQLWGGNVGHAAFRMTLKDTEENRALVEQYLSDTGIPYQRKTYQTKYSQNNPNIDAEVAYEEAVIEIYFSYWPSDNEKGYTFYSLNEDSVSEREGVDVTFDERWKEELESEFRRGSGVIGSFSSHLVSLNAQSFAYLTGQTDQEKALIAFEQNIHVIFSRSETAGFIISKLNKKIDSLAEGQTVALSPIEQKVIKRFLPDENVEDKLDLAKLQEIKKKIVEIKKELNREFTFVRFEYTQALIEYNGGIALARQGSVMSEEDKLNYEKIIALRKLRQRLIDIVPDSPHNLKKINEEISDLVKIHPEFNAYFSEYKEGIRNRDEYGKVMNILNNELDPKQNGLLASCAGAVKKGDLNALCDIVDSINRLKEFKVRLDAYVNAKGLPNAEECRKELISLMNEIANHSPADINKRDWLQDICVNRPFESWNAEYEEHMIFSSTNELNPNGRHSHFTDFLKIINAKGCEVIAMLTAEKADALFQQVISRGLPPSGRVNLPIEDPEKGILGMNAEAMLIEMSQFVKDARSFNFVDHNCSVSSSRILAAGAGDKGPIFRQALLSNSIYTPQVVFNNSVECEGAFRANLTPGDPGYLKAVQDYFAQSFIHRAGNVIDPNRNYLGKVLDLAVGASSAATAGSIGAVRGSSSAAYNVLSRAASLVWPASSAEPQAKPPAEKRPAPISFSSQPKREGKAEDKAKVKAEGKAEDKVKKPNPSTAHLKDTSANSLEPTWPGKGPKPKKRRG